MGPQFYRKVLMKFILCLLLLSNVACSQNNSDTPSLPEQRDQPQFKSEIDLRDVVSIPDLLPTMYYTPQESKVSCKGKYRRTKYNGKERTTIRNMSGKAIATVCTRFYRILVMEGSAVLRNGNTINYSGKASNGSYRFHLTGRCIFGEGIGRDNCLLPYHTIAGDKKVHFVGEIIYIPAAKGILLPDGSTHTGHFIVRDTGGAFNDIGSSRVDLFVGLDPDNNNAFQQAGFHHKNRLEAFKIEGASAEIVKDELKAKFPELF